MPEDNALSIADVSAAPRRARVFWIVFAGALALGVAGAWHYSGAGLTLSHYDARAHLVVARRIVDSLTPGWRQLGGVWLPLPHLLNVLPAQWDWAYRTGAVAVALSIAFLAVGLAALAARLFARTGSMAAALTPPALILANPNVLYLQSTPMTEPILIGLSLAALSAVDAWLERNEDSALRRAAWLIAALVMTRYEGWLIGGGLVLIAAWAAPAPRARSLARLVAPAGIAMVGFLILSWASTGRWVLSMDFFVPEGESMHHPLTSLELIARGLQRVTNPAVLGVAAIGVLVCFMRARRSRSALLPLILLLSGLLPLAAFDAGHPFRIRYVIPLVAACGVLAGVTISAASRRIQPLAAIAIVAVTLGANPLFDAGAPMVVEAQWETPFRLERGHVTDVLRQVYDGTPVLASMGSLAHYMHETSAIGFPLRNFLHEGNGDLWSEALKSPRRSVRWILIEERAEGGDMLAARAKADPEFLSGFRRLAEGGGLVLYRRD